MEFDQSARDELQKTLGDLLQQKNLESPTPVSSGVSQPRGPMGMSPEASKLYYEAQMKQPDMVAITPNDRGFMSNFLTGMKQAAADRLTMLDGIADWVSKKFGVEKGGAFGELAKSLTPTEIETQDQSFWAKLGRSAGHLPQMFGEISLFNPVTKAGLGALGLGSTVAKIAGGGIKLLKSGEKLAAGGKAIADISLPLTLGGMGAGETAIAGGSPGQIAKAGAWGAGTGLGFEAMRPLGALTRVPATGLLFGGPSALQGNDAEQVLADTLLGMGMALPGVANKLLGRRVEPQPRPIPTSDQLALPPGKPAPLQIEYKGGAGTPTGEAPPAENFSTIISGQTAGDAVALGKGGVMRTPSAPPNVGGEITSVAPEKPIELEPKTTPVEAATKERPLNKKDREILKKLGFKTKEEQDALLPDQVDAFLELKYKKTSKEGQEILTSKPEESIESQAIAGTDLTKMSMAELDSAEGTAGTADQLNAVREAKKIVAERETVGEKTSTAKVEKKVEESKVETKQGAKVEFKDSKGNDLYEGDEVEWKYGKGNNFSRKAVVAPNMPGGKALLVRTPKGAEMEVSPEAMKTLKNNTVRKPEVGKPAETPKTKTGVEIKDSQTYNGKRMTALFHNENEAMRVAIKDGKEVGYIWYEKDPTGGFKVHRIEVEKAFQRQGIASQLLKNVEAELGPSKGAFSAQTPAGRLFTEGRVAKDKAVKGKKEVVTEVKEDVAAQERIAKAKEAAKDLGPGEEDLTVENLINKMKGDPKASKEVKDEIGKFAKAIEAVKATADTSKQKVKLNKEAQASVDLNYMQVAEAGKVGDILQAIATEGTVEKAAKAAGVPEGQVIGVWIKEGVPKAAKEAEAFAQWRANMIKPPVQEVSKPVQKTAREKFDQTGDKKKKVTVAQEAVSKIKKLAKNPGIEPKMAQALETGGVDSVIKSMPGDVRELVVRYLADKPSEQALLNEMAFRLKKLQEHRSTVAEQAPRLALREREQLEASLYRTVEELRDKLASTKLKSEERVNIEKAYRAKLKNIASQVDAFKVKETSTKFQLEQIDEKVDALQKSLLYNTAGLEGRAKNFYANQFVAKDSTSKSLVDDAKAIEARIDEKTRKEIEAMTGKKWDDLKDFIVKEVQARTPSDKKLKAFKGPVTHLLPKDRGQTAYLGWVSTFAPEYRRGELGTAIFLTKLADGKYTAELVDMNFSKVKEIPGTKAWDERYTAASPEVKRDMDLLEDYFRRNPKKLAELHELTEVVDMNDIQIEKEILAEKEAYEKVHNEVVDEAQRTVKKAEIAERINKYEKLLEKDPETGKSELTMALEIDRRNLNMKLGRIWAEIAKDKLADPINIGKVVGTLDIVKDIKSQAYKVESFTLDPQYPRDPIHREVLERVGINFKTSNEKFRSSPSVEPEAWQSMERAKIAKRAEDGNFEFTGGKFDIGEPTAKMELGRDITVATPEDGWAQSPRLVRDNIMDWRTVSEEIKSVIQKNPALAGDIAAAYREARQNLGPTVGPRKGRLSKEGKMMEGTIGRPELLKKRLKDSGSSPESIKMIEDMIDEASKEAAIDRSMTQKMPIEVIPWGVRKPPTGQTFRTTVPPAEGIRGFGREEPITMVVARKNLSDAVRSGDRNAIRNAKEVLKMTKESELVKDQIDIVDVVDSKLFTIDHNRPLEQLSNPEMMAQQLNDVKVRIDKAAQNRDAGELLAAKAELDDIGRTAQEKSIETQNMNSEASKNIKKAQNKLFDIIKDFVDEGVETPEQAEAVARQFVRDNRYKQQKEIKSKKAAKGMKLGFGVDPTDLVATGKAIPEALLKMGRKVWGTTTRWGKYPEAKAELERILPYVTRITSDMKPEFFKPENLLSTLDPRSNMGAGPVDAFGALYNNASPYARRVGVMGVLTDVVKRTQRRNIVNFMGELDDIARKSEKGYEGAWIEAQNAIEQNREAKDPQAAVLKAKIKPVLDQMSENRHLKDKGLHVEGYWPHKVQPEAFWRNYRGMLQESSNFEGLPEFLQDRLEPDRFAAMKKIAQDNPTWEHMSMPEKLMVQKDLYNWVGRFTYETLPPDIQEMIPREKFAGHEQERSMGKETYKIDPKTGKKVPVSVHVNPRDALLEYLLTSNHVATTNDFLAQVRPIIKSFPNRNTPGTIGNLMEKYVRHNMLGGDTLADKAISTLVKTINDTIGKNYDADKTTRMVREGVGELKTAVAAGVLGPATATMNLFQGVHELVDTGRWPILRSLRVALSESAKSGALSHIDYLKGKAGEIRGKSIPEGFEGAWDLLNTSGRGGAGLGEDLRGIPLEEAARIRKQQEMMKGIPSKFKKIHGWMQRMALSPLTFTENMNKAGHIMAALETGAKEGLTFRESLSKGFGKLAGEFDMGKDISQKQWDAYLKMLGGQYGAGAPHTSPYLRGPLASISSIFWSYPLKTLQFIHTGLTDSVLKGDSAKFTRYLAYIGAQATLASAVAYLGGDVAHIFGMGILPSNALSMPWQMLKNAYTSAAGTNEQDRSKAQDDLMGALATISIPGYKGWGERTYKMFKNMEQGGRVTTKGEYKLVSTSPIEEVLSYLGIHPIQAREAYEQVQDMRVEGQDYTFKRNNYIADALHQMNSGRTDKILDILTEARDKGIKLTMGDVYKAKQDREKYTYLTKMTSRLPKGVREKYQKKIKELEKEQFPGGKEKVGQGDRPMWSQSSNPSLIEALSSLEGITE